MKKLDLLRSLGRLSYGLVFGMLGMRTKSVGPGIIVPSGLNAVTNLEAAAQN